MNAPKENIDPHRRSALGGFILKEVRHILRDRRTLLILFGMPLAQLLLFGFAIRNEVTDVHLAVVDHANDYLSQELVARFGATETFDIVDRLPSEAGLEAFFRTGKGKQALIIAPDFAARLASEGVAQVELVMDATDPNYARTVEAYATQVISGFAAEKVGLPAAPRVEPVVRMRFNQTLESVYLFVPGLTAFILMLVSALMTSITIAREKETGTMETLLVSPLRPLGIITGKVVPYVALASVNAASILILARVVFGVPMRGSAVLLALESLLFILTALALGVLISTRTSSQQTAMMISLVGLLLPTLLLSGFIFPIASMPEPLQWISNIVPAKWFLLILRGIMLKGLGIAYIWKETAVLGGMCLLLLIAGVRSLNIRLDG